VILASAHFGFPLSTTQVCTGSIIGSGVGKRLAQVRWGLFGRMATAWVVTLPAAAAVGGIAYAVANGIGGTTGVAVVFVLGVVFVGGIYQMSRRTPVDHNNVEAEWTGSVASGRETVGV
jgi:PiT family inorganic phosphate transporter